MPTLWSYGHQEIGGCPVMAQYDYRCEMCNKVTTVRRSMEDNFDRNPYCEACMIPMSRIWTANPIHFKGKGWGGSK
jgi:putative FmdB family regulatory protein